jgi:cytochrome c oxidase cbb3-type subunit IV
MTTKPIFGEEKNLSETYKALAGFAQTWGLIYFLAVFVVTLIYAFWPSLQAQFDESARIPLRED